MSGRPVRIGVFDSGVGGLTVLRELLQLLPAAEYFYLGDTARLPYGSKSAATVTRYALASTNFLEALGADLLVIACNTATALSLPALREAAQVPAIGVIEPGADAAAVATRSRRVAVLGTEATISSHAYHRALAARGVEAVEKACPLLVPLVEEGWVDHPVTEQVAHIYLDEMLRGDGARADTLLLGCTHYPLLRPLLRRVAPSEMVIVDSAESTAQAVQRMLPNQVATEVGREETMNVQFFTTDSREKFRRLGERFLQREIGEVELVDLENADAANADSASQNVSRVSAQKTSPE